MPEKSHRLNVLPVLDDAFRPLWSVMIPTYNCAPYLREALASVLAQDPGPEIMQIEVVDDHSTEDDPAAVVEALGAGRVGFFQQPRNLGYIDNFDTCLRRARGRLVHLLHGDDYVRSGFYEKLQGAFEARPDIGAAFCRHIYMDEQGHWQSISLLERSTSGVLHDWLRKIASGQRVATPSVVVRREVYERLGGFDHRMSYAGEDWEMWVRIAAHYPVWFEAEPLAAYRVKRAGALTDQAGRTNRLVREMCLATEIIEAYLPTYLPQKESSTLLSRARETYASWALEAAQQALVAGQGSAAFVQVREALRCSPSAKTVRSAALLLLGEGTRWMGRKVLSPSTLKRRLKRLLELFK